MSNSAKEKEARQFYCPVKDCPRAVDGFPRLGQLTQVSYGSTRNLKFRFVVTAF